MIAPYLSLCIYRISRYFFFGRWFADSCGTQVAALQVLDAALLQCRQLTDGSRMMAILMEQQDLAELIYDVLYSNHLPLLE